MTMITVICRLSSSIRVLLSKRCADEDCPLRISEFREVAVHEPMDTHKFTHQVVNTLKIFEARLKELQDDEKLPEKEIWWDWILELAERLPILGFLLALFHLIKGDKGKAKRALARCTHSSAISAGAMIGMLLAGPLGSSIGAGIATPIGILLEDRIAQTISDEGIRNKFEPVTWERILWETLINMLATGAIEWLVGCIASNLAAAAVPSISAMISRMRS